MNRYMIERDIPEIGSQDQETYKAAAAKSNAVLAELGSNIKWIESYVSKNQTYCVYEAKDEDIIKKHAEISGFPASRIRKITTGICPATAE